MKIMRYSLIAMSVLAALLILFINRNLAGLAELVYPGSAMWAHIFLLLVELLALTWFWRGLFGRHAHLLLMDDSGPEGRQRFAEELARRMKSNPLVLEVGLSPGDPEFQEKCLALLEEKANAEIERNARRIFLATALSQNGRLDALIVFVSLCRLVWRVAAIYNQRPHPREVVSLYGAVISTTFLALSIEELDIATEVSVGFGESFQAMAPASVTASIPFAGKALQTFTTSTIDGTANCYLALRAGIITRNAYMYRARQEAIPGRAAVFREAGALLLGLSGGLVDRLARTIGENIAGVARYAQDKTVQAGMNVVDGIGRVGQSIGSSAGKAASGTVSVAQSIGSSAGKAAAGTVSVAGKAVTGTVSVVQSTGSGLLKAGVHAGSALGKVGGALGKATWTVLSAPRQWIRRK